MPHRAEVKEDVVEPCRVAVAKISSSVCSRPRWRWSAQRQGRRGEEAVGDVLGPAPWLYCDPRTGRASARRRRALELARMAAAVAMGEVGFGAGGCAARRQRPSATAALEAAAGGMVATADGEQAEEKRSG
jgi:hypothetical protein